MNLSLTKSRRFLVRKLATVVLISASVAAFATLGDGNDKFKPSLKTGYSAKNFSLSANFRSGNFTPTLRQGKFIMLNTVITYQKGNATYIIPVKKRVLLDKITFNPAQRRF